MVTMIGISDDYKKVISELLELEYDAIAYETAIERLESIAVRQKLAEFLAITRQPSEGA